MDILRACEDLANSIACFDPFECSEVIIPKEKTQQWQHLFGLTEEEAIKEISDWRADFGRTCMPLAAWQEISTEKRSLGFDKESYEYSLSPRCLSRRSEAHKKNSSHSSPPSSSRKGLAECTYLVKLGGSIPDAAALQQLAGLSAPPSIKTGEGDATELFGVIDGEAKVKLLSNLPDRSSMTIISISRARKDLSSNTAYPTLGLDTTLPQNKPSSSSSSSSSPPPPPRPSNEEYPVWYFFYGTLADEDRLGRLLGPDHPISLTSAWITGGRLGTWAGRYKALVDDFDGGRVHGYGFLVLDQQAEDALRYYETGAYEVVRCDIHLDKPDRRGSMVKGLTFRYIGGALETQL
ncbi:hypothetical protein B0I35DRAFT_499510 [Stachybotrys elegans]|uniref:Putative gamma-glutamylcyclotransferase n=1 Tax=Stachybotrys elegans TaxID=80388 RepID=A0A8K0T068_9HYPO|nr:hypothetical protein B0I35DRAFT_499510 [Stachybotrys elegans]